MFKLALLLCCYISGILCAVEITSVPLPEPATYPQNPFWDGENKALTFADILGQKVFSFSYDDDEVVAVHADGLNLPGFFIPVNGSNTTYVTTTNSSAITIEWDGTSAKASNTKTLFSLGTYKHVNSAWGLRNGQFYFGTYDNKYCASKQNNSVYEYSGSGHVNAVSNGSQGVAGIVSIGNLVYYVEPCTETLWVAKQSRNGRLSDPELVLSFSDNNDETFPIGLTADTSGNLYVCGYKQAVIYIVDPVKKQIVDTIDLPTNNPTSATFGGPKLDILYVTSSVNLFDFAALTRTGPVPSPNGDLFKVTGLGAKGVRSYRLVL